MIFIHDSAAISPQQSFGEPELAILHEYGENKLRVIEPVYEGIPAGMLRRMGKAVKIGVGVSLPILKKNPPVDGIVLGTADGGLEDCIKFLNQIVEYEEGMLAPANFVQSTANAVASQIGLLTTNKSYNITHVHRGHAFENALMDAGMLISENPGKDYLLAGVDEISSYNFNIDRLNGWHKKEAVTNKSLYDSHTPGTMAGEGAVAFLVNGKPSGAKACVKSLRIINGTDSDELKKQGLKFIQDSGFGSGDSDLLLSGENGDSRVNEYYEILEGLLPDRTGILRYKHLCGEYPTASAYALWLACQILQGMKIPSHMVKREPKAGAIGRILIYNSFKKVQHSFFIVELP
jgi:Beta-ketoacyl synthase, N-terminal domain